MGNGHAAKEIQNMAGQHYSLSSFRSSQRVKAGHLNMRWDTEFYGNGCENELIDAI